MELKTVRTKSRPAIFNLKAPEAVTPRLPGDAQAALCLSSRAAPHAAQRPASNTLCLCPCRGLKYTKETQTVSAFPRRRNALSLSLDDASKARTFLVTISSQRKRPGLGSEARAGCTRDKDACCPWRPATRGPVRPRLAASPNSPLPTTQNALTKTLPCTPEPREFKRKRKWTATRARPFPLRSAREPQPWVRFPFSRKKQRCRHVCTSKRKGSQCEPLPISPHLILTSTLGGDSRPFPTDQGERSGKMKRLDPSSRIRGLRSQFWERRRLPPGLAATSDRL